MVKEAVKKRPNCDAKSKQQGIDDGVDDPYRAWDNSPRLELKRRAHCLPINVRYSIQVTWILMETYRQDSLVKA